MTLGVTNWSGDSKGSGCNITPLTTLKMAVFAAIPSSEGKQHGQGEARVPDERANYKLQILICVVHECPSLDDPSSESCPHGGRRTAVARAHRV